MIKTPAHRLAYIKSWQESHKDQVNLAKLSWYYRNKNWSLDYSRVYGKGYRAGEKHLKQSLIQWLEGEKINLPTHKRYGYDLPYSNGWDEAIDTVINHIKGGEENK